MGLPYDRSSNPTPGYTCKGNENRTSKRQLYSYVNCSIKPNGQGIHICQIISIHTLNIILFVNHNDKAKIRKTQLKRNALCWVHCMLLNEKTKRPHQALSMTHLYNLMCGCVCGWVSSISFRRKAILCQSLNMCKPVTLDLKYWDVWSKACAADS